MNEEIIPWENAKVHVFTPIVKYATAVFEGIRGYWNEEEEEIYLFKLREHMRRLRYSQSFMRFDEIADGDRLIDRTMELVRVNGFRETIHIRVMVFVDGESDLGAVGPVGTVITAVPRPLPKKVVDGCSAQVSSWLRIPDHAMPLRVKCNANYNNGRLALMQARADGYDAAILGNTQGKISEGPSMCFFMVRDGVPVTPSVTSDILESITRDTLLQISREYLDLEPVQREIDSKRALWRRGGVFLWNRVGNHANHEHRPTARRRRAGWGRSPAACRKSTSVWPRARSPIIRNGARRSTGKAAAIATG